MKEQLGRLIVFLVLLVFITSAAGADPQFDHTHQAWSQILNRSVIVNGLQSRVDYTTLKKDPTELANYCRQLSSVSEPTFHAFSESQRLAFLINAYNAFTVQLIVKHFPVASIKNLGSLTQSVWDRPTLFLLGREQSLNDIEHTLIRKNFKEPRIHFALVCAALSCPRLAPTAYTADKLAQQLEQATRLFLTDPERNRYDTATQTLFLSKIFSWYAEDFKSMTGDVRQFVAPYFTLDPEVSIAQVRINYLPYNWGLNQVKSDTSELSRLSE